MVIDAMLCNYAEVFNDRLYVTGANISRFYYPQGAVAPFLLTFGVGGLVTVPWDHTNREQVLQIQVITEDGEAIRLFGQDDLLNVGGEMRFNVGRSPLLAMGESQMVPFAFNFQAIPLQVLGRYVVLIHLNGIEVKRLNFTAIS